MTDPKDHDPVVNEPAPRYVVRDHGLLRFGVWDTERWRWVEAWGADSFPPYEGVAEHRAWYLNRRRSG